VSRLEQLAERGIRHQVDARENAGVIPVVGCHIEDIGLRGDAEFSFGDAHADGERARLDLLLFRKPGKGLAAGLERGKTERRALFDVGQLHGEGANPRERITWHVGEIR